MIGHSIVYWARCDWCKRDEIDVDLNSGSPETAWDMVMAFGWARFEVGERTLELCRPCSDRLKALGPFHTNGGIDPAYGTTPPIVEVSR